MTHNLILYKIRNFIDNKVINRIILLLLSTFKNKNGKLHKIVLLFFLISFFATLKGQNTIIVASVNTQTSYLISNIKKITFSNSANMQIAKFAGSNDDYIVNNLGHLIFKQTSTGYENFIKTSNNSQIYPNPVINELSIKIPESKNEIALIELLSIEGKLLYKKRLDPFLNIHHINVSFLSSGVYLCRIYNGEVTTMSKIIKQ